MKFPEIEGDLGARVVRRGVVRARAQGPFKFSLLAGGPTLGAYSNSLACSLGGLYRRVMFAYDKNTGSYNERPKPSVESIAQSFDAIGRKFLRGAYLPVRCGLLDYPKLYTGGKRKTYQRAVDSLLTSGISSYDARVNGFVKVEATKPGADPRLIQTRSPRYHAMLGTFLKLNEKGFYHGVDMYFGEKTITKGLNGLEIGELIRAKFNKYSNCVAVGLDASRFDRSVSIPVLKWVHNLYRAHIGRTSDFDRLLKYQLENVGRINATDGYVKYTVEGGVMSGDVDTSLKGCLIMCAMVGNWLTRTGVRASLLNNGDDCVVFMEKSDLGRFENGLSTHFASLGFDIVAEEPVYEIERIEFCQAKPVKSSTGEYIMCRNPRTASSKDAMSRVNLTSLDIAKAWAGAVAACGQALANDMPIFCEYYGVYERYSQGKQADWIWNDGRFANGLMWLAKGLKRRNGVTDETRISFWRAWGIAPHEQRAIEEYYAKVNLRDKFEGPVENLSPECFHAPETVRLLFNGR